MKGRDPATRVASENWNERLVGTVNRFGPVWFAVLPLFAVSSMISPAMFQFSQVLNVLQVAAFLGVLATGQTLALLIGGIDLARPAR